MPTATYSIIKYLSNTSIKPGPRLRARDIGMNKEDKALPSDNLYSKGRK